MKISNDLTISQENYYSLEESLRESKAKLQNSELRCKSLEKKMRENSDFHELEIKKLNDLLAKERNELKIKRKENFQLVEKIKENDSSEIMKKISRLAIEFKTNESLLED